MKLALVPILMLLVLSQTFSKWLVVVEYQLNKEFVAKTLCENKAKPKLHCNGKCQMMKRLAEEEKENAATNTTRHVKINVQEVVLSSETFMPSLACPQEILLRHRANYQPGTGTMPLTVIFHPPALT